MERLGDLRTGAADGVRRVLADELGAARIESIGSLRALHAAEPPARVVDGSSFPSRFRPPPQDQTHA